MYFNNKLVNSTNKPKTTWNIIKTVTNNKKNPNEILKIEINGKIATHHKTIAEDGDQLRSVTTKSNIGKSCQTKKE